MGRTFLPLSVAACALLAGCGGSPTYDLDGGDQITVGSLFVDQRGCRPCHQSTNSADGILSGQTTPQPNTMAYGSNLTPDHATGIGDWADEQIIRSMRFGIDDNNESLCPPMKHYTDMTDLEAGAIVAYLRSLPPVTRTDGGIPKSTCPPIKPMPAYDLGVAGAPLDLGGTGD